MATIQVRMDEAVKARFDKYVKKVNASRAKNGQSKLTTAQALELAVDSLINKMDVQS